MLLQGTEFFVSSERQCDTSAEDLEIDVKNRKSERKCLVRHQEQLHDHHQDQALDLHLGQGQGEHQQACQDHPCLRNYKLT